MSEYLVRETGYPGAVKQEVVGEIVRCKDCKYSYESLNNRICSHGVCVDCVVTNDFYCADGKRREDNETD